MARQKGTIIYVCEDYAFVEPENGGGHELVPRSECRSLWGQIGRVRVGLIVDYKPKQMPDGRVHATAVAAVGRATLQTGSVVSFKQGEGWGLVRADGASRNVFFPGSELKQLGLTSLREGQRLQFDVGKQMDGKPVACNLKVIT